MECLLLVFGTKKRKFLLLLETEQEKTLFYLQVMVVFASELKAFQNFKTINTESLNFFLSLSYVPSPRTIFNEINKLKAGTYIQYGRNINSKQIPYWSVDERFQNSRNNFAECQKKMYAML